MLSYLSESFTWVSDYGISQIAFVKYFTVAKSTSVPL